MTRQISKSFSFSAPHHRLLFFFLSHLLLLLLLILFLLNPVSGYGLSSDCYNTGNYTRGSTYNNNLNTLLSSLSKNTPPTGFFNDTVGQYPNQIFGTALCQGDLDPSECKPCIETAVREILRQCPNRIDADFFSDQCSLRYNNTRFFYSSTNVAYYSNTNVSVTDPIQFTAVMNTLLAGLLKKAAYESPRMFATGEKNITKSETLYAMMQCSRDLSTTDCYSCLQKNMNLIQEFTGGKSGAMYFEGSCFLRYELYLFYKLSWPPPPPALPLLPSPPPPSPINKIIKIVIPVAVVVIILAIAILTFIFLRRPRGVEETIYDIQNTELQSRKFASLSKATNNFSDLNKLGQGGFGQVYKGLQEKGQEIAVKRLAKDSSQGLEELEREVDLLVKLQHRNLVTLLDYCLLGNEKLVVYEYMSNTSLDKFLLDPAKRKQLDWATRFKIIKGVARGLQYLHEDSLLTVVHRDLKPSNILLDAEMNPKISDFGLARPFGRDQTHIATCKIAGTFGYIPPEVINGQFSMKSDVYSFGVIVLEIVTGQRKFGSKAQEENLLSYVWRHWSEDRTLHVVDQSMVGKYSNQEVLKCVHCALLCVQEDPSQRPEMSSVVHMLSSYRASNSRPGDPGRRNSTMSMGDSSITSGNLHDWIERESSSTNWNMASQNLPR